MFKSLQSLRYISIIMVFLGHFQYGYMENFMSGGTLAVSCFTVLSGFVLSLAYGKKVDSEDFSTWKFCLKFLKKVYPLHLLCTLYIILVNVEHMTWADYLEILPSLLLIQSWIPIETYYWGGNAVSWFLSNLLFAYAMFPTIQRFFNRLSDWKLTLFCVGLLTVFAVAIVFVPEDRVNDFIFINPLSRLVDFILGMAAYRMMAAYKPSDNKKVVNLIEFGCLAGAIATIAAYPHTCSKLRESAIHWPASMAIIMFLCAHEKHTQGFLSSILSKGGLYKLGNCTFEFFLIHFLIILTTVSLLNKHGISVSPLLLCVSLIVFTTAVSYVIHKLLSPKKH